MRAIRGVLPRTFAAGAAALAAAGVSGALPAGGQPLPAVAQQQQALPVQEIEFAPGHDIESAVCGKCHQDIYDTWKNAVHGRSLADPIFQAGLAEAIANEGADVASTCLTCHSPGSVMMERPVGNPDAPREGIGCRFCHAIRSVDLTRFPAFDLETELVMLGPYDDLESPVHQTRRSEILGTPEYCAGCHEYTTPGGANVLSTYTEFTAAQHAEPVVCQDCHMPFVLGQIVGADVRQPSQFSFVDSHAIPGGRNLAQVRRAVSLDIVSLDKTNGSVDLRVAVENSGAGHAIPTGMPSKHIVLEVSTTYGNREHTQKITFGRRIVDDAGGTLRSIASIMTRGARIDSDTRLRPGQRREFSFTLPAPIDTPTKLIVRLYYESTESPALQTRMDDILRIERDL